MKTVYNLTDDDCKAILASMDSNLLFKELRNDPTSNRVAIPSGNNMGISFHDTTDDHWDSYLLPFDHPKVIEWLELNYKV